MVLALSLLGCGGDDPPADSAQGTPTPTATAEAEPTETATPEGEPTETATPEAEPTETATPAARRERSSRVSRREAIRIARKRAGGGRVTDVDRDDDDGRAVWEIEIQRGRVEHDVTVAVRGGRILDHDRDRDDD